MAERRYLADTHVVLWALSRSPKLPVHFSDAMTGGATWFISAASIWEMAIKKSIGKLDLPDDFVDQLAQTHASFLPIQPRHAAAVAQLPFHHHDPFDRMLVAQAQMEELTLLTVDKQIARYRVTIA